MKTEEVFHIVSEISIKSEPFVQIVPAAQILATAERIDAAEI